MPIFQYPSEGEGNLPWRETAREGEGREGLSRFPREGNPHLLPFHSLGRKLVERTGVNYCDMREGLQSSHASSQRKTNCASVIDSISSGSFSFLTSN